MRAPKSRRAIVTRMLGGVGGVASARFPPIPINGTQEPYRRADRGSPYSGSAQACVRCAERGRIPWASGGPADSSERRVKAGERLTGLLARWTADDA
jgi:hypothetical protein